MSNLPAIPDEDNVGLGDLDGMSTSIPRLKIVHTEGVFEDSLSNKKMDTLNVVVLGVVLNRVLWDGTMKEDAKPLCKSVDNEHGFPGEDFPFKATAFDPVLMQADDFGGYPCEACPLQEWGSNPMPGNDSPWCTQQFLLPVAHLSSSGNVNVSILTFQKSGITPTKKYLESFRREGQPAFTAFTTITLETEKRGNVTYSKPKFVMGSPTPDEYWPDFAAAYRSTRKMLTTRRTARTDDDKAAAPATPPVGTPVNTPAASAPAPAAAAAPAAPPVPAAADDDDAPW